MNFGIIIENTIVLDQYHYKYNLNRRLIKFPYMI
jgi:hypothetical protein